MTPPAPRRTATAALLALLTLTGCAATDTPTAPAPSTWAIPTETTPPTAGSAVSATATSKIAATTRDPSALTPTQPPATDPTRPTDIPTATAEVSNPTYDINDIDRGDPAQVAWAYLTHRLSHSYTDPIPGAGLTAAAQFATPDLADKLVDQTEAATNNWSETQMTRESVIATVTHLTVYRTGIETAVIATWNLTVSAPERPLRTTSQLSTTVALTNNRDIWEVVNDGFSQPG